MISISKLGGSGQAASYYEKADYYTKGEDGVDISSSFQGELAKEFGLEGKVDKEKFVELLDGKTPDGKALGTMRDGKMQHTPGWDLTFSAPKSVSILALVGNDKEVMKAHHNAVANTLMYLERDVLKSRMNTAGYKGEVDVNKALFAKFTHTTSRKLDPQLHTHSVLLNMGRDEFGDLKSIDSRVVYDNAMLLGQIYRNELAKDLSKQGYGIEWDANKGLFEVAGVSKELIEQFSKRREEIEKKAAELGIDGAKGLDKVTVGTRDKKKDIGFQAVVDSWDKQTKELEINPSNIPSIAKEEARKIERQEPRGMLGNIFKSAHKEYNPVEKAVEHLSYYEAAFKEKDVLQEALKFSREKMGYGEIKRALEELKQRGDVIPSRNAKGFITTKEAVRQENYILNVEKDNRGKVQALAEMPEIESKMKEYNFTDGQKSGFVHLLKNEDRFTAIQGHAGVGKTYMLRPYVEMAKQKGFEVRAVAPMGKAADVLGQSIGVKTNTLASLLLDFEKENKERGGKTVHERPNENRIYIIDEASTINSRDMADLVTQVSRTGGRVIFTGDRAQLGGVERGKTFAQLQDNGMSTSYNQDIVRQRGSKVLLDTIEKYYGRDYEKAFNNISDKIVENHDRDGRVQQFVSDYIEMKEKNSDHIAVVMDNDTRHEATSEIRNRLQEGNKLGKEEVTIKQLENAKVDGAKKSMAQYYQPGMQVRFLQDYKKLKVGRDSYYKVVSSNTREVILSDGKKTIKWNPEKVAGNREKGGVVAYKERDVGYSIGDTIRFKDRNNEQGYKNGTIGKVVDIKDGKLVVTLEKSGKSINLDPGNMRDRHFEHGYLDTAFVAQGATGVTAQVLAESYRKNLLNDSSMLVGITRPENDIRLYVDDTQKVVEALKERSGIKQGALDHTNNRPASYMPFDKHKGVSMKDHLNDVQMRSNQIKQDEMKKETEKTRTVDTFVSKPPEREPQMPKQVDREKTFLP